jgi:hypothetical protein
MYELHFQGNFRDTCCGVTGSDVCDRCGQGDYNETGNCTPEAMQERLLND